MDEATVVFSRQGLFRQRLRARDIKSREDARHLWPFVNNSEDRKVVTWVRPSFSADGAFQRRSHFKHLPRTPLRIDAPALLEEEERRRKRWASESPEHDRAKTVLANELSRRIAEGVPLIWTFKDTRVSDFHLRGDLLCGARRIKAEQQVSTAFGQNFVLDIAVLGERYRGSRPILLGGVEIEKTHEFEGRKALLGRALAFPLISVDITGMTLEQLTPEWARSILEQTTLDREDGRRFTYVYLHDVLYPLFVQLPDAVQNVDGRHQYLVFASDDELASLLRELEALKEWLGFSGQMSLMRVNGTKNAQARKPVLSAGSIVGADWEQYNNHQFLRITLDTPSHNPDQKMWLCHMLVARILLRNGRSLIGYQYRNRADNHNPDEDLWVHRKYSPAPDARSVSVDEYRVLPKRLADSLERMMSVLSGLGM